MLNRLKNVYQVAKGNKAIVGAACGFCAGLGLASYNLRKTYKDVVDFKENTLEWCRLVDEQVTGLRKQYWEIREENEADFCKMKAGFEESLKVIQEDAFRKVQEAKTVAEEEAAMKYQNLLREMKESKEPVGSMTEGVEKTGVDSSEETQE